MKTMQWVAMLGCAMALAATLRGADAGQEEDLDVVILNNANATTVPPTKITKDDYVSVEGKWQNKPPIKQASYLVKEIIYADKDTNYSLALEKRDEGRYTLAAKYFSDALDVLKDSKWAPEYCNYGVGNVFFAAGIFNGYSGRTRKYPPAADYFKKLLEISPKSRFMLDAVVKLPVCYAEQEPPKLAEADAALKDAEGMIQKYRDETKALGTGYSEPADRAGVLLAVAKARVAERKFTASGKGTAQGARDLWHEARMKAAKYPDLIGECFEGELRNMIQMKQYTQAMSEANLIIEKFNKESDYSLLPQLPAAYMSMGKANFAQADEYERKGNRPLADPAYAEARWAFLNIIAQFFDNDEYVAEAHFWAGSCYEKLIAVEPSDAQTKAIREWQAIVANFPKSEFKKDAVKKLEHYGIKVAEAAPVPKAVPAAAPAPAPVPAPVPVPAKPDTPKKPKGK